MSTDPNIPALELKNLRFSWPGSAGFSLHIPELRLMPGQHLFIRGASGSGKTTLLNILSGIQTLTEGEVIIAGETLQPQSGSRRDAIRAEKIGVVFQQLNLIPYLSILDNVRLAGAFSGKRLPTDARIAYLLNALGLNQDLWHGFATQLSVGQQQRVAIARALAQQPTLLIADEPTSALDADNRDSFMRLLLAEATAAGTTVIFVSHDPQLASYFSWQLDMASLAAGIQGRATPNSGSGKFNAEPTTTANSTPCDTNLSEVKPIALQPTNSPENGDPSLC